MVQESVKKRIKYGSAFKFSGPKFAETSALPDPMLLGNVEMTSFTPQDQPRKVYDKMVR